MSGDGDGDEPWSEGDLFDLDSALSFGARIEEIAVFLRREVEDVERKALGRTRPNKPKPPRHDAFETYLAGITEHQSAAISVGALVEDDAGRSAREQLCQLRLALAKRSLE
jgi:hypothetical protein